MSSRDNLIDPLCITACLLLEEQAGAEGEEKIMLLNQMIPFFQEVFSNITPNSCIESVQKFMKMYWHQLAISVPIMVNFVEESKPIAQFLDQLLKYSVITNILEECNSFFIALAATNDTNPSGLLSFSDVFINFFEYQCMRDLFMRSEGFLVAWSEYVLQNQDAITHIAFDSFKKYSKEYALDTYSNYLENLFATAAPSLLQLSIEKTHFFTDLLIDLLKENTHTILKLLVSTKLLQSIADYTIQHQVILKNEVDLIAKFTPFTLDDNTLPPAMTAIVNVSDIKSCEFDTRHNLLSVIYDFVRENSKIKDPISNYTLTQIIFDTELTDSISVSILLDIAFALNSNPHFDILPVIPGLLRLCDFQLGMSIDLSQLYNLFIIIGNNFDPYSTSFFKPYIEQITPDQLAEYTSKYVELYALFTSHFDGILDTDDRVEFLFRFISALPKMEHERAAKNCLCDILLLQAGFSVLKKVMENILDLHVNADIFVDVLTINATTNIQFRQKIGDFATPIVFMFYSEHLVANIQVANFVSSLTGGIYKTEFDTLFSSFFHQKNKLGLSPKQIAYLTTGIKQDDKVTRPRLVFPSLAFECNDYLPILYGYDLIVASIYALPYYEDPLTFKYIGELSKQFVPPKIANSILSNPKVFRASCEGGNFAEYPRFEIPSDISSGSFSVIVKGYKAAQFSFYISQFSKISTRILKAGSLSVVLSENSLTFEGKTITTVSLNTICKLIITKDGDIYIDGELKGKTKINLILDQITIGQNSTGGADWSVVGTIRLLPSFNDKTLQLLNQESPLSTKQIDGDTRITADSFVYDLSELRTPTGIEGTPRPLPVFTIVDFIERCYGGMDGLLSDVLEKNEGFGDYAISFCALQRRKKTGWVMFQLAHRLVAMFDIRPKEFTEEVFKEILETFTYNGLEWMSFVTVFGQFRILNSNFFGNIFDSINKFMKQGLKINDGFFSSKLAFASLMENENAMQLSKAAMDIGVDPELATIILASYPQFNDLEAKTYEFENCPLLESILELPIKRIGPFLPLLPPELFPRMAVKTDEWDSVFAGALLSINRRATWRAIISVCTKTQKLCTLENTLPFNVDLSGFDKTHFINLTKMTALLATVMKHSAQNEWTEFCRQMLEQLGKVCSNIYEMPPQLPFWAFLLLRLLSPGNQDTEERPIVGEAKVEWAGKDTIRISKLVREMVPKTIEIDIKRSIPTTSYFTPPKISEIAHSFSFFSPLFGSFSEFVDSLFTKFGVSKEGEANEAIENSVEAFISKQCVQFERLRYLVLRLDKTGRVVRSLLKEPTVGIVEDVVELISVGFYDSDFLLDVMNASKIIGLSEYSIFNILNAVYDGFPVLAINSLPHLFFGDTLFSDTFALHSLLRYLLTHREADVTFRRSFIGYGKNSDTFAQTWKKSAGDGHPMARILDLLMISYDGMTPEEQNIIDNYMKYSDNSEVEFRKKVSSMREEHKRFDINETKFEESASEVVNSLSKSVSIGKTVGAVLREAGRLNVKLKVEFMMRKLEVIGAKFLKAPIYDELSETRLSLSLLSDPILPARRLVRSPFKYDLPEFPGHTVDLYESLYHDGNIEAFDLGSTFLSKIVETDEPRITAFPRGRASHCHIPSSMRMGMFEMLFDSPIEYARKASFLYGSEPIAGSVFVIGRRLIFLEGVSCTADGISLTPTDKNAVLRFYYDAIQSCSFGSIASYCGHIGFSNDLDELLCVRTHSWVHSQTAAAINFLRGQSFILILPTPADRNKFIETLKCYEDAFYESAPPMSHVQMTPTNTGRLMKQGLQATQQMWVDGQISTFVYLSVLNALGSRSFCDLTQFPVFPWTIADYTSKSLRNAPLESFRDLRLPMGQLSPARAQNFDVMFEESDHSYFYGSHYMHMGVVLYFLFRKDPFCLLSLHLHKGWDHPNRMFYDVGQSYLSASELNNADVKELVPNILVVPEFMDGEGLGMDGCSAELRRSRESSAELFDLKPEGECSLERVGLPAWASSARDFCRESQAALESDKVSRAVHSWIDLIFGYKSRGQWAVDAKNVFHPLTYGLGAEDGEEDAITREANETCVVNFGQCPQQLFSAPHPQQRSSYAFPTLADRGFRVQRIKLGRAPRAIPVDNYVVLLERNELYAGHSVIQTSSFAPGSLCSAASEDGAFLAAGFAECFVGVWRARYRRGEYKEATIVGRFKTRGRPSAVCISATHFLAISAFGSTIETFDIGTGGKCATIDAGFDVQHLFIDDGRALIIAACGSRIASWTFAGAAVFAAATDGLTSLSVPRLPSCAESPFLVSGHADGRICVWVEGGRVLTKSDDVPVSGGCVDWISVDERGARAVVLSGGEGFTVEGKVGAPPLRKQYALECAACHGPARGGEACPVCGCFLCGKCACICEKH